MMVALLWCRLPLRRAARHFGVLLLETDLLLTDTIFLRLFVTFARACLNTAPSSFDDCIVLRVQVDSVVDGQKIGVRRATTVQRARRHDWQISRCRRRFQRRAPAVAGGLSCSRRCPSASPPSFFLIC